MQAHRARSLVRGSERRLRRLIDSINRRGVGPKRPGLTCAPARSGYGPEAQLPRWPFGTLLSHCLRLAEENGLALEAFVGSVAAVQEVGAAAPEKVIVARSSLDVIVAP